jgi:hypothetical protein
MAAAFDENLFIPQVRTSHVLTVPTAEIARGGLFAFEGRNQFFGAGTIGRLAIIHGFLQSTTASTLPVRAQLDGSKFSATPLMQ